MSLNEVSTDFFRDANVKLTEYNYDKCYQKHPDWQDLRLNSFLWNGPR
jgi:hypothetical protein